MIFGFEEVGKIPAKIPGIKTFIIKIMGVKNF
jgi:hypothetical protein